MGQMFGAIVAVAIFAALAALVQGVFLQLAAKWVTRVAMLYGHAFKTALVAVVANIVVFVVLGVTLGFVAQGAGVALTNLLMLPGWLLITSAVISSRLDIPFGKSILVALIVGAFSAVLWLVLFLLLMLVGVAAMS